MLEIRNVTKIYKSKSGNEVKALDNVSVTFPDSGMVFILGKSGSGKSTMLNVIGGLDSCDSGEFIIKGKSSTSFVGSDFDAYRNTFIGFIFQEYNILDDFTVGANIALALELQGKKATDETVNSILYQVDLLDYAKRKPNELSGGQKQRVAIARALVKDPEIIMADEPTGALDSNTGKQILDALKYLSKTKLVIVVSHDRDFAERYADRIIEMKDGRIESDVTKHEVPATQVSEGIMQVNDNILRIEKGYQLTEKDLKLINEYLSKKDSDILISGDTRVNDTVRSAAGISASNTSTVFNETDSQKDIVTKPYNGAETKFIRSRLPMKNAIKMGASSLSHKKIRLVFTIFLSLIAFALFGFADTLASYDKVVATTNSIIDSDVKNASFSLELRYDSYFGDELSGSYFENTSFNSTDISKLSAKTGIDFTPVFNGSSYIGNSISLTGNMITSTYISYSSAYNGSLYGFASLDAAQLDKLGFTYTGTLPANKGEIAISKLIYDQFKVSGFRNSHFNEEITSDKLELSNDPERSLLGKTITVNVGSGEYSFKITAVIDTKFDTDRYKAFIPDTEHGMGGQQGGDDGSMMDFVMQNELANTLQFGYHSLGYVVPADIEDMAKNMSQNLNIGQRMDWIPRINYPDGNTHELYLGGDSALIPMVGDITWFEPDKTSLGENEMLVSRYAIYMMRPTDCNLYNDCVSLLENFGVSPKSGSLGDLLREAALRKHVEDNLDTHRDEIAAMYEAHCSVPYTIDEDLIQFVLDVVFPYGVDSPFGNPETVAAKAYRNAIKKLYGIELDSYPTVTDDQVINDLYTFLDQYFSSDAESFILTNSDFESIMIKINEISESGMNDEEIRNKADILYTEKCGITASDIASQLYISIRYYDNQGNEINTDHRQYKIVGFFEAPDYESNHLVISDSLYSDYEKYLVDNEIWHAKYAPHEAGIYAFVIAPMPDNAADVRKLVELNYSDEDGIRFTLQNQVTNSLDFFNEFIEIGASVFIYVGLGFAVFAALMMMNFISTSISYKRREIGILRAVGARSSDVFKIFFSEAFIIALINYVLATIATVFATVMFNSMVRSEGINVTLLNFGIRQVVVMLLISVFVAALASFLPVWSIARRKPVDAIKNT